MGEPVWYWILFAAVIIGCALVPICVLLERKEDERNREAWSRVPGSTR